MNISNQRTTVRIALVSCVLVLALASAGCSRGKGEVSGRVTFNGVPLPDGRIGFHPEQVDKVPVYAVIRDGEYKITDCPTGPVRITVETFRRGSPASLPRGLGIEPSAINAVQANAEYVAIPTRYRYVDQSGLGTTVKRGKQDYEVTLTP
jgi:hypothetical protein